ncbi:MAG: DNA polymerase/3'-5' exonuclease PolX [Candidatus Parcubacteria bacterium]|nr:DNA polymerase/3'-5' exonuclease PolX [Candidatus Parcubacteria bacterium]
MVAEQFEVNEEIAKIFHRLGVFLDMEDVDFKPAAYQRAAAILRTLNQSVADIYRTGNIKGLEALEGIGKNLAYKIKEYLETGKIQAYEKYLKLYPIDIDGLDEVPGLGPKTIKWLWEELGVKTVADLKIAAEKGLVKNLPRGGEKLEQNILNNLNQVETVNKRWLYAEIQPLAEKIKTQLEIIPGLSNLLVAGSYRRKKPTIGDLDYVAVVSKPLVAMETFTHLQNPKVEQIISQGKTRSSIRLADGLEVDLRVVAKKSYGAACQYFTGSKEHNIELRKIAIAKGFKLNEYGLFKGTKQIAGASEEEIYKTLGLRYIEPELRENAGEIEWAQGKKKLGLIDLKDIKGDLHIHSDWDGGKESISDLAEYARLKLGYEYIGISDHTKFLKIEHGLDEEQLMAQRLEIQKLNAKYKDKHISFTILQGCEANILGDGSLDITDTILKQLDYVIAGLHSQLDMEGEEITARMLKAINNPYIDIISHPFTGLINRRPPAKINWEMILTAAKQTGTILEINANPVRLDLEASKIREAKRGGIKLIIDSDTHSLGDMNQMEYGIGEARRGWATKENIINTFLLTHLVKQFKRNIF